MIKKIRRKFTTWYYKKGYRFGYIDPSKSFDTYYKCPRWVKPLLIFFSPSVYFNMVGLEFSKCFTEAMNSDKEETPDGKM